jgi:hypothetical protein
LFRHACPTIDLYHLRRGEQSATAKLIFPNYRCTRAIVTAVVTGIELRAATVCIARVGALKAVVTIAINLSCDSLARTLAEAFALTAVGTSYMLHPIVARCLMGAYLDIIAYTSVGIWIALVAEGRRVAAVRVILHTTHATGRRRTPSPFL